MLDYWREQWEVYQNRALEEAGSSARVDHRARYQQAAPRHLGKAASALKRNGEQSRIGDENRAITTRNQYLDELVSYYAGIEAEKQREVKKEFFTAAPDATCYGIACVTARAVPDLRPHEQVKPRP